MLEHGQIGSLDEIAEGHVRTAGVEGWPAHLASHGCAAYPARVWGSIKPMNDPVSRTRPWQSPRDREASDDRSTRPVEVLIVVVVVAAVVAVAIWFLFISSGGIGPGTV
jgi:hypothetical protein